MGGDTAGDSRAPWLASQVDCCEATAGDDAAPADEGPQHLSRAPVDRRGVAGGRGVHRGAIRPGPSGEGRRPDRVGLVSGQVDLSMQFIGPSILQVDVGDPLVLLAGIQIGCYELFGTERVRAIRDLRGRPLPLVRCEAAAIPSSRAWRHS